MDFVTIGSFLLYLLTFLFGFLLEKNPKSNQRVRKIYVIWLYLFLCFGYMTGQDWDGYEPNYLEGEGLDRYLTEPISYFLFTVMPKIIPDFWVFTGFFKCVFLYSLLRFLKSVTSYWLSATACLMPICLLFLLISNPFRFMLALCFIILALNEIYNYYLNGGNRNKLFKKSIIYIFLASCVHNTSAIYFILIPFLGFYKMAYRANRLLLIFLYLFVFYLTSNLSLLTELKDSISLYIIASGGRDYGSWYEYEDSSALFAIGNVLNLLFMILISFSKEKFNKIHKNGKIIYGFTIIYFFIVRILLFVPNGFRLTFPFSFFYAIAIIYCLRASWKTGCIIMLYLVYSLVNTTWFSYDMVPYSNSIPYIIAGHKPFNERLEYNKVEYIKRTGDRDRFKNY